MDRGAALFLVGVVLVVTEITVILLIPHPDYWANRGLGLATPIGIALCIYSGVYARRARIRDGGGTGGGGDGTERDAS